MFLLTWKPTNYQWADYELAVSATKRGEVYQFGWSCGNRRTLPVGSRVVMLRQGSKRGVVGVGTTLSEVQTGAPWKGSQSSQARYVDVAWRIVLSEDDVLSVECLNKAVPQVNWDRIQASGTELSVDATQLLEQLWISHLRRIGRARTFEVGEEYTRQEIYRILDVPPTLQGGDWNTGSHRYGDDWFIFASVGSAGRTGHDYENYWDGDEFIWRGRTGSKLDQKKTQAQLKPAGSVHIFTRESDRAPFCYEGIACSRNAHDDD